MSKEERRGRPSRDAGLVRDSIIHILFFSHDSDLDLYLASDSDSDLYFDSDLYSGLDLYLTRLSLGFVLGLGFVL